MAAVAPSADQTSDLLQNLSLDSQAKTLDVPELPKKVQSCERSMTPLLPNSMDPTLCYNPYGYPSYYYGCYNGTSNEWDDYSRYPNTDGVDVASGAYGNNGSIMYQHAYGYGPYGPYSPAASPSPTMGNDDQSYGLHQYQYPPYLKPLTHTSRPFTPNKAASPQGDHSISTDADQKPLPVETAKGDSNGNLNAQSNKGTDGSAPYKPKYQSSYGRGTFHGGLRSPTMWLDTSGLPNGQCKSTEAYSFSKGGNVPSSWNHNFHQNPYFMELQQMYQKKLNGQYGNGFKSGMSFGYSDYVGWWQYPKPRGRGSDYVGYRNGNIDGLNEVSKGPRTKAFNNHKGLAPVTLAVNGQSVVSGDTNVGEDKMTVIPDEELYNRADFPENYADARFYIIKSYSEDDVHKSIKYNVWSSTSSGNKKLDAAYKEAQQKSDGCPVFLFFSVNTSGQFVGLAEMVGPVDFDKNVEHWQQDKWPGCFPVKWHIVKDVPNSSLKHLTLENNENKPVTNSRDTQEVKLEQGLKMIKIFKDQSSKTSILDDFGFYEVREKIIREKKAKQQLIKKVWEGRAGNEKKEVANDSEKLLETTTNLIEEPVLTAKSNGEVKLSENGLAAEAGDESKAG